MKTDRSRLSRRAELIPRPTERTLCLADLVQALHSVARDDAEVAAVLEYMLSVGHIRLARTEALAA
jgi:hypothetical protein